MAIPTTQRASSALRRHRLGLATLAVALFVWGAGAVTTPAPELQGSALIAVLGLLLLALTQFYSRRHGALARLRRPRTQLSLALYGTSALLASLFLQGLFVPSRSTIEASAPAATERPVRTLPAPPRAFPVAVSSLAAGDPRLLPSTGSSTMSTDRLRILSLNVWHGYPGNSDRESRYLRIRDLAIRSSADVVLLQEAWSTRRFGSLAERLAGDLGFGYAYARANGSLRYLGFEEGLAILSRYPISGARKLSLAPRMPPWEMRAALGAVITLPAGDSLALWDAHLSHADAFARDGQARSLAAALAGSDVAIVGGDFNAPAASAAVTTFAALDFRPVLSEGIDHILASAALREAWTPVHAEAVRFGEVAVPGSLRTRPEVSDHPALLIELQRRSAGGTTTVVESRPHATEAPQEEPATWSSSAASVGG